MIDWSSCFYQCTDALGAQHLLNLATVFDDCNLLKVGMVRSVGNTMGERNIVTERGSLTAMSALSHFYFLSSE